MLLRGKYGLQHYLARLPAPNSVLLKSVGDVQTLCKIADLLSQSSNRLLSSPNRASVQRKSPSSQHRPLIKDVQNWTLNLHGQCSIDARWLWQKHFPRLVLTLNIAEIQLVLLLVQVTSLPSCYDFFPGAAAFLQERRPAAPLSS